jgi:hypothetical protein
MASRTSCAPSNSFLSIFAIYREDRVNHEQGSSAGSIRFGTGSLTLPHVSATSAGAAAEMEFEQIGDAIRNPLTG